MAVSPSLLPADRAHRTFRWDLVRGIGSGLADPLRTSVGLLIAIRVFDAPEALKPFVPAAHAIGLLLTPVTMALAVRSGWKAGTICGLSALLGSVALGVGALTESLSGFLIAVGVFLALSTQHTPLMAHIYTQNYARSRRGQRVSTMFLLLVGTAAIGGYAFGWLLDQGLDHYRTILLIGAVAGVLTAISFLRMPTESLPYDAGANPLHHLALLKKDPTFAVILGSWMLMGIGNLMTLPLRIEYIANPERLGFAVENTTAVLIVGVVPTVVQLLMTKPMGAIFDSWNLIDVRNLLNFLWGASIVLFFVSTNLWVMTVAMILMGVGSAGGQVTWSLWVTHVAPPRKAGAYMSVHTFSTGIRALLSPFLGFWLISFLPAIWVGFLACGLVLASSMIALTTKPEIERRRQDTLRAEAAAAQGRPGSP